MKDPVVVAKSPNKPNIRYSVIRVSRELEKSFGWLVDQLKVNHCIFDRVICVLPVNINLHQSVQAIYQCFKEGKLPSTGQSTND
jgi:hypothetical protein